MSTLEHLVSQRHKISKQLIKSSKIPIDNLLDKPQTFSPAIFSLFIFVSSVSGPWGCGDLLSTAVSNVPKGAQLSDSGGTGAKEGKKMEGETMALDVHS